MDGGFNEGQLAEWDAELVRKRNLVWNDAAGTYEHYAIEEEAEPEPEPRRETLRERLMGDTEDYQSPEGMYDLDDDDTRSPYDVAD